MASKSKTAKDETEKITLTVDHHDVVFSSPQKIYFPDSPGGSITKLDVARYYLEVKEAALRAVQRRPMILKRYVHGITEEPFFQKRVPKNPPSFIETAVLHYRSGGSAEEVCVVDGAGLVWVVNLGCVELHVHPVRKDDLDHPDELRIDLDPGAGFGWSDVVNVAGVARAVLDDVGLVGFPKTSGSRGVHIWVRIAPKLPYDEVRRAALNIAKEIERRLPGVATTTWQKTERHGVLVDYNQNAKDRTTCAAWSVRAVADARVSMPLTWDALFSCDPAAFTLRTVPALLQKHGDPHAAIDDVEYDLTKALALEPAEAPKNKKKPAKKKADDVIVIATAETRVAALDGLARWKARHEDVAAALAVDDILIDSMRGASSVWWRVRVHLRNVPETLRPPKETPDPNWQPS